LKKILLILTISSLVFLFSFAFRSKIIAYCCGGWYWCCEGAQPLYECSNNCHSCSACQGPPPPTCTPGACGGCTPSCPAGQSTTVSGPLCLSGSVSSCTGSNGCDPCTLTGGACYYPETNITPSIPASISIIVDGKTYALSTNPAAPTQIKLPAVGSSNVQISVPTFTAPATSRGGGYYFIANNYGVADEWKTWTTCSGIAGEDFCTTVPNTNNTQNFVPTTKTVNQTLKEGATGKISGMYTTLDKCNNTYKYSLPREGYYVVDTVPVTPPIVDPENLIPDITTDITAKGCTSTTYSGSEVNNPIHIEATTSDTNSNSEIEAFVIWLSKDNTVPTTETISASYTGSTHTDLGIMIKKNGATWDNPNIYSTNADLTWGQITDGYVRIGSENIIRIYDVSVTQTTNISFDYKLELLTNTSNFYGEYNIYGGVLDTYMINGNILDQSYFKDLFNWGIDLVNPTVDEISQQVQDPTNTRMTWGISDSLSGIGRMVMNAYRTGGTEFDQLRLYLPAAYTTLKGSILLDSNSDIPASSDIGLYNGSNTLIFDNNIGETDQLNIGTNEGGSINVYVTAYDKACNTSSTSESIDLDPWFASRGGMVYSQNNISSNAKDVSSVATLDDVFNVNTLMDKSLIDLGTELLATRNTTISTLIHSNLGAVKGALLYDSNNSKNYWFDQLMSKFSHQTPKSTPFNSITTSVSSDCFAGTTCAYYSEADITIPSGYVCDVPTLFATRGNINIEPNVTSDQNVLSGCIFLAGNNINILDGDYKSTGSIIEYDYLEGFMIAENQINIPLVDISRSLRDGVEIFGGAVALGSTPVTGESAISIKRDLRLFSQINPAVVLTYDNKYSSIATIFFGAEAPIFRQEVGFKSF